MKRRILSLTLVMALLFCLTASVQVALAAPDDQGIVDLDLAWLSLGDTSDVTSNLTLPAAGPNGSIITWSSGGSPYLWDNGTVMRPPSGATATVTLTATVTSGIHSGTKAFTIVMRAIVSRAIANVKTAPDGPDMLSASYSIKVPVRTAPKLPYRVWVEYTDGYAEWRNTQWPWSGSYGSGPAGANTPANVEQIWQGYQVGRRYTVTGWITGDSTTSLGYPMTVNCTVVSGDFTMPEVNGIYRGGNTLVTTAANPASFDVPAAKQAKTLPINKVKLRTDNQNRLTSNVTRSVIQAATGSPWEVTRWLYNYRDSFGLSVSGYTSPTGWESPTTKLRGHGAGHYIDALALTYNTGASTDENRALILEKLKRFISEARTYQEMTFYPLDWVGKGATETYETVLASGKTWKDLQVTKWREAADTWPYDDTDKAASAPNWPYPTLTNVTSSWDSIVNTTTRERGLNARDPKWFGYGYLNATPPIHLVLNERYGTYSAWVWAPYYGVHKQLAGYMDVYYAFRYSEDPELREMANTSFQICKDMSHWISNRLTEKCFLGDTRASQDNPKVPGTSVYGNLNNTWYGNISGEFGGVNESIARCATELAANDPDKALLIAGTEMFYNKSYMDTLTANSEIMSLNGNSHANSRIPIMPGALWTYSLNHNPKYYVAAKNFWDFNAGRFRYYGGNVGNGEWYRAPYTQIANIGTTINETCCAMNLCKLSKDLATYDPDNAEYMDYYERLTFNQLIGSVRQTGGTWGVTYQYAVGPNTNKPFGNTDPGANCCGGTGVENPSRYIESVYLANDDTIWVNMMVQTDAVWDATGYTVSQDCTWPAETSTISVAPIAGQTQKAFAMKIRVPWWATKDVSIKLNGVEIAAKYLPSSFVEIPSRVWSASDRVVLSMPFQKSIDYAPDKSGGMWAGTVFLGPLAMSGTGAWSTQNIEANLSNLKINAPEDFADTVSSTPGNNRNVYTMNLTGDQGNTNASILQPDYFRDTNSTKYFRINILGLDGANKTALFNIVQRARGFSAANYSAASFAALQPTVPPAVVVYQNNAATQEEVDAQVALIQAAIDNLLPNVGGKTDLLALINLAKARRDAQVAWLAANPTLDPKGTYDNKPWAYYGYERMLAKLTAAQTAYDNAAALQLAVDTAFNALKSELDTMRIGNQYEAENLVNLKAMLDEALVKVESPYTAVSYQALLDAMEYANETVEIIEAGSSTMGEYPPLTAEKRLRDAIDGLDISFDTRVVISPRAVPEATSENFALKFNMTAKQAMGVTLIVVSYDENGVLVNVDADTVSLTAGALSGDCSVSIPRAGGTTFRFYVWDGNGLPMTDIIPDTDVLK